MRISCSKFDEIIIVFVKCIDFDLKESWLMILIEIVTSQLSIYAVLFDIEMLNSFESSMSLSNNILAFKSFTKCTSRIIIARTFLSCLSFFLKYIEITAYRFVVCLFKSSSRTVIEIIMIRIETRSSVWALKKTMSANVISVSEFTQSVVDDAFKAKMSSAVACC